MEQSSTIKLTYVEAGTYSITSSSLTFGSSDNGQTWARYQNDVAIIDGGGSGYIDASGVSNFTIKGLTFQNLGIGPRGPGMYINGSNITIRWNTFLNSNQSAISGAAVKNSLIDSNTIDGQFPGNPAGSTSSAYSAINFWLGTSSNQITHNLIKNCQGGGICITSGVNDPPINNNVIDRNMLIGVDTNVVDNGGLYLMDRTHNGLGNQITNNVVQGNGGSSHSDQTKAIYLDDQTSNVLVSGNILWGGVGQYGIQVHGGDHNTVQRNIFVLAPGETLGLYQDDPSVAEFGMTANRFSNNIVYYKSTSPNPQWRWGQGGTSMAPPTDTTNLYYSATGASIANGGNIVDSSPVFANPQFQSASTGNFSMPSTSPAYTSIGWVTLPTDQGPVAYQP